MTPYRDVAAYVLAGGESSRMGQDKGLLAFAGVPLIVRTVDLVKPLVNSVTVVVSRPRYRGLGFREIQDREAGSREPEDVSRGPLAGIAAALADSRSAWNLILACDLPHLSGAWLDRLLSRATSSCARVVVPRSERGLDPLAAMYHLTCGPSIAASLASGARKVTEVIGQLPLEVFDRSEWRDLDPRGRLLRNMNTPQDYLEALEAAAETECDTK